jgi:hypothetical protein
VFQKVEPILIFVKGDYAFPTGARSAGRESGG